MLQSSIVDNFEGAALGDYESVDKCDHLSS